MSDFSIQPAGHSPIHSIRHVASSSSLNAVSGSRRTDAFNVSSAGPSDGAAAGDRVELSDMAKHLARMRDMPDTRQDRVDSVRSAIDRGVYDTEDRLDVALDRALEQLMQEEDQLGL